MSLKSTLAAVLVVGHLAPAAPAQPAVTFAPPTVDLGQRACGRVLPATAWVINTGDAPLVIEEVRADCLAIEVARAPHTAVAPGAAVPLELTVTVPEQTGAPRDWGIVLRLQGGATSRLPVRVEPTAHDDPFAAPPEPVGDLRFVPDMLDLGPVEPGGARSAEAWLLNAGDAPITAGKLRTTCGCLTVRGHEAGSLAPGEARRVEVTATAPSQAGKSKRAVASVMADETYLVKLTTWVEAVHPLVARLEAYRDARRRADLEAQRALLAEDSRIWFETRDGPGTPRGPSGDGPWAGWDREMGSSSKRGDVEVDGSAVSVIVEETNDYYRLLDRPASRIRLTYWFDDEQRIEGFLVQGLDRDEPQKDRYEELEAWARAHRPAALGELLDGDRIVPSEANARRWRALMLEWRRAVGLPIPALPEWEARLDRTLQTFLTTADRDAFDATLSDDYRLWLGSRGGEALDRAKAGELFEWRRACRADVRVRDLRIAPGQATGVFHEIDDFARLLDGEGWSARVTFWFDAHGRISGQLCEPVDGAALEQALEPALPWLMANRADELARVYVDGQIVHGRDSAVRWLDLLRDWRRATGRAAVDPASE